VETGRVESRKIAYKQETGKTLAQYRSSPCIPAAVICTYFFFSVVKLPVFFSKFQGCILHMYTSHSSHVYTISSMSGEQSWKINVCYNLYMFQHSTRYLIL